MHPHLRRLQWLSQAPALWCGDESLGLSFDPEQFEDRVDALTRDAAMLAQLDAAEGKRLGHYFEVLYQTLLTRVYDWKILAANLAIRDTGRTLGELDLIARNPTTNEVEHHEIAIKFYLGHASTDDSAPRWYGPNSRDRFDLKLNNLFAHQSRLCDNPVTRDQLQQLGIPQPQIRRVILRGYLFYPADEVIASPDYACPGHLQGSWCRANTLPSAELENCVELRKPDWLGPFTCATPPDPGAAIHRVRRIADGAAPGLFARMHCPPGGPWIEQSRFFVVGSEWPVAAPKHAS